MFLDAEEQVQWTKRLKIELEHNDLVEKRNASYVLETAIPLGFLTIFAQLGLIKLDNLAYFVIFAGFLLYAFHALLTERYDRKLMVLRKELDGLLQNLEHLPIKEEEAKLLKPSVRIRIAIASGYACLATLLFLPLTFARITVVLALTFFIIGAILFYSEGFFGIWAGNIRQRLRRFKKSNERG
jgi:hypothetical protein